MMIFLYVSPCGQNLLRTCLIQSDVGEEHEGQPLSYSKVKSCNTEKKSVEIKCTFGVSLLRREQDLRDVGQDPLGDHGICGDVVVLAAQID